MRALLTALFLAGCNLAQPRMTDGGAPPNPLLTPAQQRAHEMDKHVPMKTLPPDSKPPQME
jgi:hypothetical protein